ncbi:hypothetical protein L8C07_24600 [Paenibacillus sp. CMAA1739]|nr:MULTISPECIES: hypothetical protein [Paenibacillus]MDP1513152.1 hypothetical protein [Paenibacillus ottowii]MEC4569129.1 hypothetical protein [Paenibacillus sp. CMAA1739]
MNPQVEMTQKQPIARLFFNLSPFSCVEKLTLNKEWRGLFEETVNL